MKALTYTINSVSKQLNISKYTLRYYEKEGIIPPIKRDHKGNRTYNSCDIQWIELVCCLKDTGMPLSDIKKIVQLSASDDDKKSFEERLGMLADHKEIIVSNIKQMQKQLEKIEKKIDYYKGKIDSC